MTPKRFLLKLSLVGSLAAALLLSTPTRAPAWWVHYVAPDTKYQNVWPSKEHVKRMYWHHTSGGWGASVYSDVFGSGGAWEWFPLVNNGTGVYVGHAQNWVFDYYVYIFRFNGLSESDYVNLVDYAGFWSQFAWVCIDCYVEGNWNSTYSGPLIFQNESPP